MSLSIAELRQSQTPYRFAGRGGRAPRRQRGSPEHDAQSAVFVWAAHPVTLRRYPLLELLYAVPNGEKRDLKVAQRLKKEGVKSGVPDLQLPVPRGGWAGLYIEMKAGSNKPTPAQARFIELLIGQGHRVSVQRSAAAAIAEIEWYLSLPPNPPCPRIER